MTISAKGQTGTLSFDGQFVTISRSGFLAATTQGKGEKRIPVSSITAVQFKLAGAVTQGFISFTMSGGGEQKSRAGRQARDAFNDENSLTFLKKGNADMEAVRDAVEAAIAAGHAPAAPASDAADQIAKLAALHAQGILSDDEFAAAKAKALGL